MSVQVSYKRQFIVYVFLILIFLSVVEIIANFWLYNIYRCDFESNEIFKNTDPVANRKLCLESLGYDRWAEGKQDFTNEKISGVKGTMWNNERQNLLDTENMVYMNKHGFRGPEITKEKPENTYRIFAIGASTTFGSGVFDTQTYPFYLQLMYDEIDLDFDIEVINSGWPGVWSMIEADAIKEKYIDFEPDLFIVYDGGGDVRNDLHPNDPRATATHWKERWIDICELGKQYDYETIITLQPFIGTGNKTLTTQEQNLKTKVEKTRWLEKYPAYVEQLKEINNHCSLTADLRGLFDNIKEPIFYDEMHTGYRGNKIIAEKMFELSLPLVMKRAQNLVNEEDSISSVKYGASLDTLEINENLDSENFDYYLEQSYSTLQTILFPYKTPKVLDLIVNQ